MLNDALDRITESYDESLISSEAYPYLDPLAIMVIEERVEYITLQTQEKDRV